MFLGQCLGFASEHTHRVFIQGAHPYLIHSYGILHSISRKMTLSKKLIEFRDKNWVFPDSGIGGINGGGSGGNSGSGGVQQFPGN